MVASHGARRAPAAPARARAAPRTGRAAASSSVRTRAPTAWTCRASSDASRCAARCPPKAQDGGVVVLEAFTLEAPQTRAVADLLRGVDAPASACWSCSARTTRCSRRARATSPRCRLTLAGNLSVRDLLMRGDGDRHPRRHRAHRGGLRMSGERSFEQVLVLPVISEKSYASMACGTLRVPLPSVGDEDPDPPRARRGVRGPEDHRRRRQHDQRARQDAPPLARSDARHRHEPRRGRRQS